MAKKKKKIRKYPDNIQDWPVIGKYIDTRTKAELKVVYFIDDVGAYKVQVGNLPTTNLKSCRFQLLTKDAKSKRKFYRQLKTYMGTGYSWEETEYSSANRPLPPLGLLKIRKGKVRKFVLFIAANHFCGNSLINITAVAIDNLLYLDLVSRMKEKA